MRRNYVSVNMKYYRAKRIDRMSKHNQRESYIDYLLPKEYHKYNNVNVTYDVDNTLSKQSLKEVFKQSMMKKKEILKKKRVGAVSGNELLEFVVALSEAQAKYYLENGIDLMDGYKEFMMDMEKRYGMKPLGISLHLDEGHIDKKTKEVKYNIHAHCIFHNFDYQKGKSVLRTLRRQDYRDMQDLAEHSFQKVKLDFKRGEPKEITGHQHLERVEYIAMKLENEISQSQQQLNILNEELKTLRTTKSQLHIDIKDLQTQKKQYDRKSVEWKELDDKVKSLRVDDKELTQKIKEQKTKIEELSSQQTNSKLTKDTDNILANSTDTIMGFEKYDTNKLRTNIFKTLKRYSKVDIELKDKKELIQQVKELSEQIKQYKDIFKDDTMMEVTPAVAKVNLEHIKKEFNNYKQYTHKIVKANEELKDKVVSLEKDLEQMRQELVDTADKLREYEDRGMTMSIDDR